MSLWRLIENILALDILKVCYHLSCVFFVVLRFLIAIGIKKCETEVVWHSESVTQVIVLFASTLTTLRHLPSVSFVLPQQHLYKDGVVLNDR